MIINLIINTLLLVIGAALSWVDDVNKLPTIGGFDIDTAMMTGVAQIHSIWTTFWPIQQMFYGFLALTIYYAAKIVLRTFFGHRAPGSHN